MIPLTPNTFRDDEIIDDAIINENLLEAARQVNDSLAKRYSYSQIVCELDGLTDASSAGALSFKLHHADTIGELISVQLVIYSTAAKVVTVTSSDTGWTQDLAVTGLGSTTRAEGTSPCTVPFTSSGVTLTLSADSGTTITRGLLIASIRCDRILNSAGASDYEPTLIDSSTADVAAALDTALTDLETAVAADTAANEDWRAIGGFTRRSITSGTAASELVWRIPAAARVGGSLRVYGAIPAGTSVTWTLKDEAAATVATKTIAGAGTGTLSTEVASFTDTQPDDPHTSGSDYTLEVSVSGAGTVDLTYAILWMK